MDLLQAYVSERTLISAPLPKNASDESVNSHKEQKRLFKEWE